VGQLEEIILDLFGSDATEALDQFVEKTRFQFFAAPLARNHKNGIFSMRVDG
jgi:hypothetical protein